MNIAGKNLSGKWDKCDFAGEGARATQMVGVLRLCAGENLDVAGLKSGIWLLLFLEQPEVEDRVHDYKLAEN